MKYQDIYKIINEADQSKDKYKLVIELRDPDHSLEKLIQYIADSANVGHSYEVIVDPDSDGKKSFGIDGDGPFHIFSVKVED